MAIVVAILLGVVALAYVLYPLYRGARLKARYSETAPEGAVEVAAAASNQQSEREQAARAALQEVEFDYQLGNLAEDDYRSLRERYMRRALAALKSRYDREREIDEVIEEQVRRLREKDEHESV